jgi:hypothetical protein
MEEPAMKIVHGLLGLACSLLAASQVDSLHPTAAEYGLSRLTYY